jgi:hypothetical protein
VNIIFHIFLAGLVIFGSFPVHGISSPLKPEDCVICGHACCCPEICAPKIKELKGKKAPSHCSVPEKSYKTGAHGCDQPVSICQFSPSDPISAILLQEKTFINPQPGILSVLKPSGGNSPTFSLSEDRFRSSPYFQETPTPPPRFAA